MSRYYKWAQREHGVGTLITVTLLAGIIFAILLPFVVITVGLSLDRLLGLQGKVVFPTVSYGITRLLGVSNAGGLPDVDWDSGGTRMATIDTFTSLTKAWLRLPILDGGRDCIGDSGAPKFLGDTDLVVAIGVGGDVACKAMVASLRLDTQTARDFLSQYVGLP